ncbi:MAG: AraC family transcriptional regulator [Bacteroidota bacterium]
MRDLPAQPEPVDTGGLSVHQIVVYDAAVETTERATGRRIFEGAVRPGDALVVRPETVANATFTTWTEGLGFTGIMLPVPTVAAAARALDRDYAALDFRERFAHRDPFLSAAARQLGHELESGTPGGRVYAEELLQAIALHLVRHHTADASLPRPPRGGVTPRVVRDVAEYVREHMDEDVSLGDLAGVAGLSPYHFSREYKRTTGESPSAMLRRVRMERSAALLASTLWCVSTVAGEVGYQSPSRFAAAFRRHFGVSPSTYRSRLGGKRSRSEREV